MNNALLFMPITRHCILPLTTGRGMVTMIYFMCGKALTVYGVILLILVILSIPSVKKEHFLLQQTVKPLIMQVTEAIAKAVLIFIVLNCVKMYGLIKPYG